MTKRSAHNQSRQSSPSTTTSTVGGATPIQQRIAQVNKKSNKTTSFGSDVMAKPVQQPLATPTTTQASRSIQRNVPSLKDDGAVAETTRKNVLPSPTKVHPRASNDETIIVATPSSHKSNGGDIMRRMNKSTAANRKMSDSAPLRDGRRGLQPTGMMVRQGSRKLSAALDEPLSNRKTVPLPSNPTRKSETKKQSMANSKPISKKKLHEQQAPEHKSENVKELSSRTTGNESQSSERNRVSRRPFNSDDNFLRMTKDKENRDPNAQRHQHPRRVTITPKQAQRTSLNVTTPLSQYDESQTQLDPRASIWKIMETPETMNSKAVSDRTAEASIPDRMTTTTPVSKKARLVQDIANGDQVSFNTPLANESIPQPKSQALLVSRTKKAEKLPAITSTKEETIVQSGASVDSRGQQPPNTMAEKGAKSKAASKPSGSDSKSYSAVRAMNGWISNVSARTFVDEAFTANQLAIKKAKSDLNGSASKSSTRTMKENPYKKVSPKSKTSVTKESASKATTAVAKESASEATWLQKKPKPSSRYCAGDDAGDDDESQVVGYKHVEVVRGKKKRSCLPGHACAECDPFWNAVCDGNNVFQRKQFEDVSRHRAAFSPESTPPEFWELSFVDERRAREKKERQEKEMQHARMIAREDTADSPVETSLTW